MHPAVVKAKRIARISIDNDWKGHLSSGIAKNGVRTTELTAKRNDEQILVFWVNEKFDHAIYSIMGKVTNLTCSKQVISKIEDWPDLIDLFNKFPNANRPNLVSVYRKLPFDINGDNAEIIPKLIGTRMYWYGHESTKIHTDIVLPPTKAKSKQCRIVDVGHRKLFHFIGAQAGFRSIILDTLLKVE